jgi:hypothetical protein
MFALNGDFKSRNHIGPDYPDRLVKQDFAREPKN